MLNMLKLPLIAMILLASGCVAVAPGQPAYVYGSGSYYGGSYYSGGPYYSGGSYYSPPVRYYNAPPIYVPPSRVVVIRERTRWSNPDRRRRDHGQRPH
ncbi:hypothetical protein [Zwartia sp.]|uniref:hypothetical protein n=1 Tax=Zwartia sp. TaxID=2978004 RepID=UPI002720E047|nr:hypothetical protein [Zwartia sp.]MDO9023950.1 hypothetical protein [Zwartia sp.]